MNNYSFIFKILFLSLIIIFVQNAEQLHAQIVVQLPPHNAAQPDQETDLLEIDLDDLDSVFSEDSSFTNDKEGEHESTLLKDVRKRGIEFIAAYNFKGIFNPGYEVLPWEIEDETMSFSYGAEMSMKMTINAQVSEYFKVKTEINYEIPGGAFKLGDFILDYNILNKVYLRAGKFEQSWGVSPNFAFTNLLARLAVQTTNDEKYKNENGIFYDEEKKQFSFYDANSINTKGTSYILKTDIPIGIGGLQLLALTRANLENNVIPNYRYIGYGGKFNLAFNWAEFNLGSFAQEYMATRAYLSVKTNVLDTDVYSEFLLGVNNHTDNSIGYGYNIGFIKSLFKDKMQINAEYFYNGEESTTYYSPETDFKIEETLPFLEDHNLALNVLYRLGGKINTRLFTNLVYGDDSLSLTLGVRVTPFSNVDVYLASQMAIGDGYYYNDAKDYFNKNRPFRIMLFVSFNGSVRVSQYY